MLNVSVPVGFDSTPKPSQVTCVSFAPRKYFILLSVTLLHIFSEERASLLWAERCGGEVFVEIESDTVE